jgi:hypothetical protein
LNARLHWIMTTMKAVLAVALACTMTCSWSQPAAQPSDGSPRRLVILVRFDDAGEAARRDIGVSGRISNRGSDLELRAQDAGSSREERVDQRVQVIEGGRATLFIAQSRPVMQRQNIQTPAGTVGQQTIVVQEAVSGFQVAPRLSGDRVFLEIAPQSERLDSRGGVEGQRLATSVVGRLGEWFEISSVVAREAQDERGLASSSQTRSSGVRRVWVKVEELRTGMRN